MPEGAVCVSSEIRHTRFIVRFGQRGIAPLKTLPSTQVGPSPEAAIIQRFFRVLPAVEAEVIGPPPPTALWTELLADLLTYESSGRGECIV